MEHFATQWLAQIGNEKGKVTPYYILRGVKKLYHFLEFQHMMQQYENRAKMSEAVKLFFPDSYFST